MKSKIWSALFVVLFIIGILFLVKTWLPVDTYIAGHDSGLAIDSKEFLKTRLYAWSIQGFGQDNSPHFGSLIIHSIDYFTSKLSGVPYAGNYINIFFWLSLIFVSAFLFANSLGKYLGKYFPIFFATFITINFFIIQSIFILERAKYSILIANLLILTFLFKLDNKVIGYKKAFLYIILTLFLFNCGSWLGAPLYGSMAVLMLIYIVIKFVNLVIKKSYKELFRFFVFLFLLGIGFVLINAYSIFPYITSFLTNDVSHLTNSTVIGQNMAWLRSITETGSYLNFFRLQGIPDWYSGASGVNLQHAFSFEYLKNPLLIISSFIFPILAFCSYLFLKEKKQRHIILYFSLSTMLGIFFMAGSHKPLGFIYEFLYSNLPGFAIFRSPYYKFASAFLIGYVGLISFTLSCLVEKYGKKLKIILCLAILSCWFIYHGVIFDKQKIFSWQKNLSTKVSIPSYVLDFSKSMDDQNIKDSRILLAPANNQNWMNDGYNWGYWSLTNLPSLAAPNQSFLVNDSILSGSQLALVNKLYESIIEGREDYFLELAGKLNIKYILLRKDVLQSSNWSSSDEPLNYQMNLDNFTSVKIKKSFEDWVLYEINTPTYGKIFTTSRLIEISNENSSLINDYIGGNKHFAQINSNGENNSFTISRCQSCVAELLTQNNSLPEVKLLPSSKLYFIKEIRDKKILKNLTGNSRVITYLGIALRQTSEAIAMLRFDSKEIYAVSTLRAVDQELNQVYEYLINNPDVEKDFYIFSTLKNTLDPIEINLKNQISKEEFNRRSESYRKEIYNVLWTIRKINNYFFAIKSNLDSYRYNKFYTLTFKSAGNYKIHINSSNLPNNSDGEKILPELFEFKHEGNFIKLEPVIEKQGVYFDVDISESGIYEGILVFNNLPNLYLDKNNYQLPVISGDIGCIAGKIKQYDLNSSYRINFSISDKIQRLKFYIKGDDSINSLDQGFFRGDIERGIDAVDTVNAYSYLFKPYGAKDPGIYICNSNSDIPKIYNIEVYEIYSPTLVIEKTVISSSKFNNISINFEMVNPTKYKFVLNKNDDRILIFNETFSPLWKLKKDNKVIDNIEHFIVDGYANAWILPENLAGEMTIEYSSQIYFYIGEIVTISSLLFVIGYGVYLSIKK